MSTTYKGIDYGLGKSNVNTQTGIRFGVISQNTLNPEALDDVFQTGEDLDFESFREQVKADLLSAIEGALNNYLIGSRLPDSAKDAADAAFDAISDNLGDCYENTGDCTRMEYKRDGYHVRTDSSGDVWVFESAFFTYAQFCSPCAPGACYLSAFLCNPDPETDKDNRAYCFGHDWFDDGKAPYPVYSVETGELVQPTL